MIGGNRFLRLLGLDETWMVRGVRVRFRRRLDGGGSVAAAHFVSFLREQQSAIRPPVGAVFRRAFEWCAGPGFIGFALLASGLCEELCLADVNPEAMRCAARTIRSNGLADRVRCYVSDNFDAVPSSEQFDLVVGNPPSYSGLKPAHPAYARHKDDLRPNDAGWRIHRRFYETVREHLVGGASLVIAEVEPHATEVWPPGFDVAWDLRARAPIEDFREMIHAAGLDHVGTYPLCTMPGGFPVSVVVSRNPGSS